MKLGEFLEQRGWVMVPKEKGGKHQHELWQRGEDILPAYKAQQACWRDEWEIVKKPDRTISIVRREQPQTETVSPF